MADIITVTNKDQKKFITENYNLNKKKIILLPNWIEVEKFYNYGKERNENNILFVGRLEDEKNPFLLLDALIKLKISGTFIGRGSLTNKILKKIKKNQCESFIKVIDYVPNSKLADFYNNHSITAMTSRYEGQPKSLLEAMACESCILATDVTGINSLIKHDSNGFLTSNDLDSFCDALMILLSNKSKRESLGKKARESILQKHCLESVAKKEIDIFKMLIK